MHDTNHILKTIKERGYKLTKVRKLVLDLLIRRSGPISSMDIQEVFLKKKMPVNKTTVYRELAFLKVQKIIRELWFEDAVRRYEITPENHHHHIVCLNCNKIEDVELHKDFDAEEKNIEKSRKFKILNHSLKFYGICRGCRIRIGSKKHFKKS